MKSMDLKSVFSKIDFVNRYENICKNHNDFENSMSGNQRKVYSGMLQKNDNSIVYISKDKAFMTTFSLGEFTLEFVLVLHSGHVQAYLNYLMGDDWLMYNRFDGYAEELEPNFNRELYNIPKYTSLEELEEILKDLFSIYEDIKKELAEM